MNPGFEDDETMDIFEAELEWDYSGDEIMELNSEFLVLTIEENESEKYPWRLCVSLQSAHKSLGHRTWLAEGWADRNCVDLSHAEWIAASFEREAQRLADIPCV